MSNIPYILVRSSHFTCKYRWDFIATLQSLPHCNLWLPLSAAHQRLLSLFRFCSCLSYASFCLSYLSLAFPRKNKETLLSGILTLKALDFFFFFKLCWSIFQFSCFPSKNATAKVKHETSFQKSLKQFLQQIGESQRHKSCYSETMKAVKVTEKPNILPSHVELESKDGGTKLEMCFRIQLRLLIWMPPLSKNKHWKNWILGKIVKHIKYIRGLNLSKSQANQPKTLT